MWQKNKYLFQKKIKFHVPSSGISLYHARNYSIFPHEWLGWRGWKRVSRWVCRWGGGGGVIIMTLRWWWNWHILVVGWERIGWTVCWITYHDFTWLCLLVLESTSSWIDSRASIILLYFRKLQILRLCWFQRPSCSQAQIKYYFCVS